MTRDEAVALVEHYTERAMETRAKLELDRTRGLMSDEERECNERYAVLNSESATLAHLVVQLRETVTSLQTDRDALAARLDSLEKAVAVRIGGEDGR